MAVGKSAFIGLTFTGFRGRTLPTDGTGTPESPGEVVGDTIMNMSMNIGADEHEREYEHED